MGNKRVSPRLGDHHYKLLIALAEFHEVSIAEMARICLCKELEQTYRDSAQNPILRANLDKHIGVAISYQAGIKPGLNQNFLIH